MKGIRNPSLLQRATELIDEDEGDENRQLMQLYGGPLYKGESVQFDLLARSGVSFEYSFGLDTIVSRAEFKRVVKFD